MADGRSASPILERAGGGLEEIGARILETGDIAAPKHPHEHILCQVFRLRRITDTTRKVIQQNRTKLIGQALERTLLAYARDNGINVVGPNSTGLVNVRTGLAIGGGLPILFAKD